MYIIDTKRKIYYNTKLNKILDLTKLEYVQNDTLIEFYKNELSKHVVLNEKIKLIEESNKIYTGYGYLIDENGNWFTDAFDKTGDFLKGMVPDTLEDWIHLGVDVISGLFDAFGAVTFGSTNVISLIIDVLHGLYYIGAAYGVGVDRTSRKEEYLLMGMITMGFAFVPGIGNAANIALKNSLKSATKSGAKSLTKKILGNGLLAKGVKKVFQFFFTKGPKVVLKHFKTILEYLSGFRLIKWLFNKLGINKIAGFFFKNADRVLDDMASSKVIKQLGKEIGVPVEKMATKTVSKVTRETAKDALQVTAAKSFKKVAFKDASEEAVAKKAMKELQKEIADQAAKKGSKLTATEAEKIGANIASKYSNKISAKGFEGTMKNLGKDTRNILVGKGGLTQHLGGLKSQLKRGVREPIYDEVNKTISKKIAKAEAKGVTRAELNAIEKASKGAAEETYKLLNKKGIKGTTKELNKIINTAVGKAGTRVTSKAAKEALEDTVRAAVKKVASHKITRHFTGSAFKKFFVKQLAAGNLIYSDNARNAVNSLLELLGIRSVSDIVKNDFINALKDVSELVPQTARSQIESNDLNEEGIRVLQVFLNKFPKYSGQTEFGDITENGVLDARTIIGEEYFISNMNNFLNDKTIYGYTIDYDNFIKHISSINDNMAKLGENTQTQNDKTLKTDVDIDNIDVDNDLKLKSTSESIITDFNKFIKTTL